jgi:hypothetical protein
VIPFLFKYWRIGAAVALLAAIGLAIHHYGATRYKAGKAAVMLQWQADTAARDLVTAEAIANAKARETAAIANNTEVLRDYNQKLVEIAADNTSLAGRVRDYQNRLRDAAASQATDQLGIAVASGIASRAAELDAAYDRYDKACQRDALKLDKLIAEVTQQL